MTDPLIPIGAMLTALVSGVLGIIGTRKAQRVADQVAIIDQVREWATQLQSSEEQCRRDLDQLRRELDVVRRQVADLQRDAR